MATAAVPLSALSEFFLTYVGQDFADFYPGVWAAVEEYVATEPLDWRASARRELADVLERSTSEQELAGTSIRLGLGYYPPTAGLTYREWLENVERYLREHED